MQALFAYLLLHQHLVPREVLMDVFWLDDSPERARSSLTTAIWRLRQLLEPSDVRPGTYLITQTSGEVGFNWDCGHWLDTKAFEQQVYPLLRKPVPYLTGDDVERIEEGMTLYRGELLEGIYDDWALRERERFRTLHLNCLTRLMEFHASRNNFEQGIAYGHEILRRDPVREEIHRGLMRLYLESGQRALAIHQYTRCRELLEQELGLLPLEETQALYQQIMSSPFSGGPTSGHLLTQEIAQLMHDLQRVKQSLDATNETLAKITGAVTRLGNGGKEGRMAAHTQNR